MKRLLLAGAALIGLATTLSAAAQFQKPEDAVKFRKASFVIMSAHFNRIGAVVKGTAPYDPAVLLNNAEIVAMMSYMPYQGFVEGTVGNGDKGTAKATIWSERAKFDESAKKMQTEATKLVAAAKSKDLDAIKLYFGSTQKACMSCHDSFRSQ
ncbi:MAG: cytochrome c [Pseudomonadota bacterium]